MLKLACSANCVVVAAVTLDVLQSHPVVAKHLVADVPLLLLAVAAKSLAVQADAVQWPLQLVVAKSLPLHVVAKHHVHPRKSVAFWPNCSANVVVDAADVLLSQLAVAKSLLLHAVAKLLDVQADAVQWLHQLVVAK